MLLVIVGMLQVSVAHEDGTAALPANVASVRLQSHFVSQPPGGLVLLPELLRMTGSGSSSESFTICTISGSSSCCNNIRYFSNGRQLSILTGCGMQCGIQIESCYAIFRKAFGQDVFGYSSVPCGQ